MAAQATKDWGGSPGRPSIRNHHLADCGRARLRVCVRNIGAMSGPIDPRRRHFRHLAPRVATACFEFSLPPAIPSSAASDFYRRVIDWLVFGF